MSSKIPDENSGRHLSGLCGSILAVQSPCFDLSNEASEPKGVCSHKNYLKTCQDATTPCLSSQALSVLVIQTFLCVFEIATAGATHIRPSESNICF